MVKAFEDIPVKSLYCGFIDVLGFGAITLTNHQTAVDVYERLLERFERVASGFKAGDGKIRVFSDSFIITSEYPGYVIQAAHLLSWLLHQEGILVRGGIAYGAHVEAEKAGMILTVSTALTKAVRLEKSVKRPCVVIADDMELPDAVWFQEQAILHYFDGLRIVNPFSVMWFRSAGTQTRRLLKMYPEHAEKYKWFLRLYDAVNRRELLRPPDIIQRYNVTLPENELHPIFPEDLETDRELLR